MKSVVNMLSGCADLAVDGPDVAFAAEHQVDSLLDNHHVWFTGTQI